MKMLCTNMKQEPVSTTQVSSGRLESSRALKEMKSTFAPAGNWTRASGFPVQRATTALPGAWYFSCEIRVFLLFLTEIILRQVWLGFLGPSRALNPGGEYVFETRTCFDHSGLIRKARKQKSTERNEKFWLTPLKAMPNLDLNSSIFEQEKYT